MPMTVAEPCDGAGCGTLIVDTGCGTPASGLLAGERRLLQNRGFWDSRPPRVLRVKIGVGQKSKLWPRAGPSLRWVTAAMTKRRETARRDSSIAGSADRGGRGSFLGGETEVLQPPDDKDLRSRRSSAIR
jgi:hypothetical protein